VANAGLVAVRVSASRWRSGAPCTAGIRPCRRGGQCTRTPEPAPQM